MATLTLKGKTSERLEAIRKPIESSSERYKRLAKEIKSELRGNHPSVFNQPSPVPLKLHIHKDIRTRYPSYPAKAISLCMHRWTNAKKYLVTLVEGSPRYDLDSNQAGVVLKQHERCQTMSNDT